MSERRFALVVASSDYEDSDIPDLAAPTGDARALETVLRDTRIGGFWSVETLKNEPSWAVKEKVDDLFADKKSTDLVLFYFSGHGLKDDDGELFLAAPNTRRRRLPSTAVPSKFLHDVMRKSMSRKQVVILDCCYGGAFTRGLPSKGDLKIHVKEKLGGEGRIVIAASDSMTEAYESREARDFGTLSIFTKILVEGLESGAADRDGDGSVSLDELYLYTYDRMLEEAESQRPVITTLDRAGEVYIARNARMASPFLIAFPEPRLLPAPEPKREVPTLDWFKQPGRLEQPKPSFLEWLNALDQTAGAAEPEPRPADEPAPALDFPFLHQYSRPRKSLFDFSREAAPEAPEEPLSFGEWFKRSRSLQDHLLEHRDEEQSGE